MKCFCVFENQIHFVLRFFFFLGKTEINSGILSWDDFLSSESGDFRTHLRSDNDIGDELSDGSLKNI